MTKVLQNALWGPPLPTLFAGLTLAWVSTTTITVNTGVASDSTLQRTMKLATALTKSTSGWAAGNAGGLDTGTIAANTGYHWYLIFNQTTGAMDVVFSATTTPLAGPTLMPSGYTHFKWIWWTLTNASSQWTRFVQDVDDLIWDIATIEVNNFAGTSAIQAKALSSVPLGLRVKAKLVGGGLPGAANTARVFIFNPSINIAGGLAGSSVALLTLGLTSVSGSQGWAPLEVQTDTARQIYYSNDSTSGATFITCAGWSIPRASVR